MVAGHERDGRGWKAEWVALPEVCLLTSTALALALDLLAGLEVDAERMRANLDGDQGLLSERVLAALTRRGSASTGPRPSCRPCWSARARPTAGRWPTR